MRHLSRGALGAAVVAAFVVWPLYAGTAAERPYGYDTLTDMPEQPMPRVMPTTPKGVLGYGQPQSGATLLTAPTPNALPVRSLSPSEWVEIVDYTENGRHQKEMWWLVRIGDERGWIHADRLNVR